MYIATITTKYNVIKLEIENTNDERLLELLEQPYIVEVKIEKEIVKKLKI